MLLLSQVAAASTVLVLLVGQPTHTMSPSPGLVFGFDEGQRLIPGQEGASGEETKCCISNLSHSSAGPLVILYPQLQGPL